MANTKTHKKVSIPVILLTAILIIQVILVLYPIAFTVSASFIKENSLSAVGTIPFSRPFSLYQYKRLFTETYYGHWFLNTLKVACMNTCITVIVCSFTGYIFSRFSFPFRKTVMASMLVLQMFPSFIGMVATYVILWKINALNTLWGLVLVYSAGSIPFNSWLMKGYFDTISKDIAEAAYIDGATPFTAFIKVVVPTAKPQIVFLALTSFTDPWMDFIFPKMVLRSTEKQTLALGLMTFVSDKKNEFTTFASGSLIVAIPFVIFFLFTQKTMITSFGSAGVKE